MLVSAIVVTVSIVVILAICFVGWMVWEAQRTQTFGLDENRFAERVRKAFRDEMQEFD